MKQWTAKALTKRDSFAGYENRSVYNADAQYCKFNNAQQNHLILSL